MQSAYGLIDPWDELPHYIGRAQDVFKRYAQHLNITHENAQLRKWMATIKAAGKIPGLLVLEEEIDDSLAASREMYWIAYYLERGAPLTNIVLPPKPHKQKREATQPTPASHHETLRPVHIAGEEYLTSPLAVQYLAEKWGMPSYSVTAFRMLRLRSRERGDGTSLEPDIPLSANTSLWKKSTLDAIPKPTQGRPRNSQENEVSHG